MAAHSGGNEQCSKREGMEKRIQVEEELKRSKTDKRVGKGWNKQACSLGLWIRACRMAMGPGSGGFSSTEVSPQLLLLPSLKVL